MSNRRFCWMILPCSLPFVTATLCGMWIVSAGCLAVAETASAAPSATTGGEAAFTADVNYLEEFQKGGAAGIALGVLFLAMIGFTVERLLRLRARAICPHGLVSEVLPLWGENRYMDFFFRE